MSKAIKKIWNVLSVVLISVIVILAILLVGARLIGLQVYTVLSGSMEPTYRTGSLIYVKTIDPGEVEVGQAITFVLDKDLRVATHRVIEIDAENRQFYTKGDANAAADGSPVSFENLLGTPVFTIPVLGYFANYIQNPPGLYIAIAVAAVLLLLVFLPDLLKRPEKKGKPKHLREKTEGSPDIKHHHYKE